MLARLRAAGLVWASVFSVGALVVLLGLGTWQLQRKAVKESLMARITSRMASDPVDIATVLGSGPAPSDAEYRRVTARGRYLHDRERYYYAPSQTLGQGVHVYTPLQLDDGRLLLVNRGFVPDELKLPARRQAGQVTGLVTVSGVQRAPAQPGAFTPANDVTRNLWFWRDLAGMLATIPEAKGGAAPFFLDADATPVPGGWPKGGVTNLDIPNRHLEYAITWYGLALTLIGVFIAFARSRLVGRAEPDLSEA